MGAIVPTLGAALLQASPFISAGTQILGAFGASPSARQQEAQQELALRQLQSQQALQQGQRAAQTSLEKERIALNAADDERSRQNALRRAVARQRASFGSSGVGNQSGGSSEAVLLGLFDETEEDLAQRERLDNLRNRALDLSTNNASSINVLQQAQLRERQNLKNQISRSKSLFSIFS